MSKIKVRHVFTSESVSEGHPDKVCDRISDSILDACLEQDPESRVACEALATTDFVVVSGEITTNAKVDWEAVVREAIREIGYTEKGIGFSADEAEVLVKIHSQSLDIAQGVDAGRGKYLEQGAGDQGMMFGYASDETPELMPATLLYSHRIMAEFARMRKEEKDKYPFLRPDAKCQLSIIYDNGAPLYIDTVVVSHQHTEDMPENVLEDLAKKVVAKVVPANLLSGKERYFVNPTGKFVIGGPHGDTGLTGRKIIVDTYGGVGSHGGGAFSGKDPSKVDRSAAYFCRYIAKNIVGAGLAHKCEVQVSYAIGVAQPISVNVDTYGTGLLLEDGDLEKVVRQVFDMRPAEIIRALDLKHPRMWKYKDTSSYGHFGRDIFPWEKLDRIEEIRRAAAPFARR